MPYRVYPGGIKEKNRSLIKNILSDANFLAKDQTWSVSDLYKDVVEIAVKSEKSDLMEKRFLRLFEAELELTIIKPNKPTKIVHLKQEDPNQLTFKGENHTLAFSTLNEFNYSENDLTLTFIRE